MLVAGFPSATGEENSQPCAAFKASPAKYLLGPGDASFADATLPEVSTSTRTLTLIVPVIVFRALCGTSGRTWCTTSPPRVATALEGVGTGAGLGAVCAAGAAGLVFTGSEFAGASSSILICPSWVDAFGAKIVRTKWTPSANTSETAIAMRMRQVVR